MLSYRMATIADTDLYYEWANDTTVRNFSYNKEPVQYENHVKWFHNKLAAGTVAFYLFENETQKPVGQVRIELTVNDTAVIGVSVDRSERGKGYSTEMIRAASDAYLAAHPSVTVLAYIMKHNVASYKAFCAAGFIPYTEKKVQGEDSHVLIKKI